MMSHLVLWYSNIFNDNDIQWYEGLRDVACLKQCSVGIDLKHAPPDDTILPTTICCTPVTCLSCKQCAGWSHGKLVMVSVLRSPCRHVASFKLNNGKQIATCLKPVQVSRMSQCVAATVGWVWISNLFTLGNFVECCISTYLMLVPILWKPAGPKEWLGRTHFWPDRMSIGLGFW